MILSIRVPLSYTSAMTITIGYARCSTDRQDLAAQKAALEKLGVPAERIYTDHGLTGTNRARPGLDQALAAVRSGDTLVVPDRVRSNLHPKGRKTMSESAQPASRDRTPVQNPPCNRVADSLSSACRGPNIRSAIWRRFSLSLPCRVKRSGPAVGDDHGATSSPW